jgi:N-acetylneuraminic acid mutarotase
VSKSCLVLALVICSVLALGVLGCFGDPETTTTVAVSTTTTTLPPTTTTIEITTTTTTTEAPGAWTALAPAGEPPAALMGSSMVCIPDGSQMLLYGGWDGAGFYSAIWSYDPAATTWTDLDPSGGLPAARALQSMVYLPVDGKVIVFGGYDGITYYNDTWAYDLAENTWTNLSPTGDPPAARDGQSMIFDPVSGKLILFGGWNGRTEFNDTWAYDPAANTWTELHPTGDLPAPRDSQAMVYDPVDGLVVLFGGWSQTAEFNDTWLYDPAANTWTNAGPAGELPSRRALHQIVYDSKTGRVVLFGGGTTGNVARNDTWIYNPAANTWNPVTPAGSQPAARTGFAMAYDSTGGKVFLFGGSDRAAFFNDVWVYSH